MNLKEYGVTIKEAVVNLNKEVFPTGDPNSDNCLIPSFDRK